MKRSLLGLLLLFAACAPESPSAGSDINRGPAVIDIDGDPNGLWWDDASQMLLVADDDGNRILRWTDAEGLSLSRNLPEVAPGGAGLGQLVVTADGMLIVPRFGNGTAGEVVVVPQKSAALAVPGLSTKRRRIGLTVTADGRLLDSWFVRDSAGARAGAVGELSLSGTEVEVLTGLKKPVGVLALGGDLFVADQDLGQILKAPLSNPSAFVVLATVPTPDLLSAGPDGSIFTGSEGGNLFHIDGAGTASVFQSGFDTIRGVAYDPTHRRLFVVNHVGHEAEGVVHSIHILPLD